MKLFLPAALALSGALAFGLAAAPARAQLVITSASTLTRTVNGGNTSPFSATLRNDFGSTLYFLGDNADFTFASGLTEFGSPTAANTVVLDDTPFINLLSSGFSLAPGQTQTVTLFNITTGPGATLGTYQGFFAIQGNTDPFGAANTLATQNFEADVTFVPETSSVVSLGLLLTLGFGGVVLASRRRKASVTA